MTDLEFAAWAKKHRLPEETTDAILRYAATPEEMQEASDAMGPSPPVYSLSDIVDMTDNDPYGISPLTHGFVLIGGCPNGDPIAIDLTAEPGAVWYLCHETMHGQSLREHGVRVAENLDGFVDDMDSEDFPFDYFEAKDRADGGDD